MVISEKSAVTIDPAKHGLKQYEMKTSGNRILVRSRNLHSLWDNLLGNPRTTGPSAAVL